MPDQPQTTPEIVNPTQVQLIDLGTNRIVGLLEINGALPMAIILDEEKIFLRGEPDQTIYALSSSLKAYSTDLRHVRPTADDPQAVLGG